MKKSAAVIPARYGSTRFPGKVLAELQGRTIIEWVHERAKASCADQVIIATDDEKVQAAAEKFGAEVRMTSPVHPSGTDRIREAIKDSDAEIIVNVQGDEPLIPPREIDRLIKVMQDNPAIEMATVAVAAPREEISGNPNVVKVVLDKDNFALYFSRAGIPFLREGGRDLPVYRHWGIYAYRRDVLEKLVSLPEGKLEQCEKLEQLRAMENGIRIFVLLSDFQSIGIDTPEDLEAAGTWLRNHPEKVKI